MAEGRLVHKDGSPVTIKEYMSSPTVLQKMQEMLQSPDAIRQFSTAVISISGSDKLLAEAEPRSLFNACLTAASLNLPINKNLGFAHIIGYNNTKAGYVEAQFQLGARGFRELAQRSGQYVLINQGDVREGELKGRNRLTGELEFNWIEDDEERAKKEIIGYFSYFKLKSGYSSTLYMSKAEVTAHGKKYSQSFKKGFGPWTDNFEAMALKTVSKLNISKNGPLDINLQKAIETDQAVIREDGHTDYIDGELADVENSAAEEDEIIAAHADPETPAKSNPAKAEVVEKPEKAKSFKERQAEFNKNVKAKDESANN